jgi:enoyl-CoA hydratase/3-hydroxyacyl-CoA dehydrogenase
MVEISNIKNIAVIGAGVQGHSIAQSALMGDFKEVIINDLSMELIDKGLDLIENGRFGLRKLESDGVLREGTTTETILEKVVKETNLEKALKNADFVIEAVPEVMSIKQEVYKKLGKFAQPNTVLASNTSTMSITKIGEASGKPDKVIGMHFFIPIALKLIEITRGAKTSDFAMDLGVAVAENLYCLEGKRKVIRLEKETPGFIVNRLMTTGQIYFNWIFDDAVDKGITFEQIDADVIDFSPAAVCLLCDIIGLDTVYNAMKYMEASLSPDFTPSKTLTKLMEQGNLGQKSGKGFYDWTEGKIPEIDKSKKVGIVDINAIIAVMLNEGCRLLEEGIVSGYKVVDDAMMASFKMPGPFMLGKRKYAEYSKLLEEIVDKSGKEYLRPCDLMKSGEFLKMRK